MQFLHVAGFGKFPVKLPRSFYCIRVDIDNRIKIGRLIVGLNTLQIAACKLYATGDIRCNSPLCLFDGELNNIEGRLRCGLLSGRRCATCAKADDNDKL